MGNASLKRRWSSWNDRRDQEEDREDLDLSELKRVELQGLRWHLSQDLLPDFRLVPPHQLWSADTCSTSQIMLSCYDKKGAMMMLEAALKESATDNRDCQFCHHTSLLRPRLPPKLGADFLKTQRRKLINGIQRLDTPLETLLTDGILNPTNLDVINSYAVQMEKNRILVDLVLRKGHIAQELFYKALSQSQPFLLQDMEHRPIVDKVCILYLWVLCQDRIFKRASSWPWWCHQYAFTVSLFLHQEHLRDVYTHKDDEVFGLRWTQLFPLVTWWSYYWQKLPSYWWRAAETPRQVNDNNPAVREHCHEDPAEDCPNSQYVHKRFPPSCLQAQRHWQFSPASNLCTKQG